MNAAGDALALWRKAMIIGGMELVYCDAGPRDAPAVLLLHGFPMCSQMAKNMIAYFADRYRVIAPEHDGVGPDRTRERNGPSCSTDRFPDLMDELLRRLGVRSHTTCVLDYDAPGGWRIRLRQRAASRPRGASGRPRPPGGGRSRPSAGRTGATCCAPADDVANLIYPDQRTGA